MAESITGINEIGFASIVDQLKKNNRSEAGRDGRHTMFLNKINETLGGVTEGLEGLSGETEKVGDAVETGNNQVSPSAVEEGEKKKRRGLFDAFSRALSPVSKGFGALTGTLSKIAGVKTGIPGLNLGRLAFFLAVPFIVKFLQSETFNKIKETIISVIVPALQFLYDNVIVPIGNAISTAFTAIFTLIRDNIDTITASLQFIYDTILVPIGQYIKTQFLAIWENLKVLFEDLGGSIQVFQEEGVLAGIIDVVKNLGKFFGNVLDDLFTNLYNFIAGIFGLTPIEEGESIGSLIIGTFKNLLSTVTTFFTETIPQMFTTIKTFLTTLFVETIPNKFSEIKDKLTSFFTEQITNVKEFISGLGVFQFFNQTFQGLKDNIIGIFTAPTKEELIENLFGAGKGLFDLVFAPINLAVNAIKDIFNLGDPDTPFSLFDFISNQITKIFDFFKSVVSIDTDAIIDAIPGARTLLKTLGILDKSPQDIRDEIAEAEDRIKRSEAGENVFFGFEEGGRAREIANIEALKEELGQIGNVPPPAENLVTNVQPDNTAPTTNVVSGPTVVDGSVNTNNRTVAPQLITNPDPFIGGGLFSVGGL